MYCAEKIFENERFRIKNGRNMPFFSKNSFLGGAWKLYNRIIQELLELEFSPKNKLFRYFLVMNILQVTARPLSVIFSEIWPIYGMPMNLKN